nr:uncharacterized protein LOC109160911 [Ipomoea trifida]
MEDQIVPEGLNERQQVVSPFFINTDCSEFPPLDHDQGSGVGDLEAMDSLLTLSRLETSSCVIGSVWIGVHRSCSQPQFLKNHLLACVTAGLKTRTNGIAILMTIVASGTVYRLEG